MSVSFAFTQKNDYKYLPSTEYLRYTSINYLFLAFILFENLFKPRQLPSATSKQCFEQPATSFLVCSLIFIEYKCSSKAFIYLTFIIYYISQKRSRILTLIDQYFLKSKNTLKHQGAILTSNIKLLGSGDLLEALLPKRRSQPSTRSKDCPCLRILQARNGDAQVSYGKYAFHH